MDNILEKVRGFLKEYDAVRAKDVVIAGVSGGGDSMAMTDLLLRLQREMDFFLVAVHVNHGIRGTEAERDQRLVEKKCREWKIPCKVYAFDIPKLAEEWRTGLEEAGRMARRKAFAETAGEYEAEGYRVRIALAHHQNDLAETMLHHLARGTGLGGLASLRPAADKWIRPLLCLERKEIEHYLKEREIPYLEDSTNLENDCTRNRIRHHLLPVMEKEVNKKAVLHMTETARILAEAEDYLGKKGRELLDSCRMEDGSFLLGDAFFAEEKIVREYAVLEGFTRLAGRRKDVTSLHVGQVMELWKKQTGRYVRLPYKLRAVREYHGVRLEKPYGESIKEPGTDWEQEEWSLSIPGKLNCGLGFFETEVFFYHGEKISEKKYTKWLNYDIIKDKLTVRTRKSGDYLVVNREGNRKKLTRCMIDEKIPQDQRDRIPLVTCGNEVLWIAGGRLNERYKITPETRRVLILRYQGGNQDERKN